MLPFFLYLSAGAVTCFHLMLLATVEPPPYALLFVSLRLCALGCCRLLEPVQA